VNSDPVLLFFIDAGPGNRGLVFVPLGKIGKRFGCPGVSLCFLGGGIKQ
jgi:hypothetical protein